MGGTRPTPRNGVPTAATTCLLHTRIQMLFRLKGTSIFGACDFCLGYTAGSEQGLRSSRMAYAEIPETCQGILGAYWLLPKVNRSILTYSNALDEFTVKGGICVVVSGSRTF